MTQQEFETYKKEQTAKLGAIAKKVQSGEMTPEQAKPYKQEILNLWAAELFDKDTFEKFAGMANNLVEMDIQTIRARTEALQLEIAALQAELRRTRQHLEERRQVGPGF